MGNKMKKLVMVAAIAAISTQVTAFEPQAINTSVGIDFTPTITITTGGDVDSTDDEPETSGNYLIKPAVKAELSTGSADYNSAIELSFSDKVLTDNDEVFLSSGKSSLGVTFNLAKAQTASITLTGEGENQTDTFIKPGIDAKYAYGLALAGLDSEFSVGAISSYQYYLNDRENNKVNNVINAQFNSKMTTQLIGLGELYGKSALEVDRFLEAESSNLNTVSAAVGVQSEELITGLTVNAELGGRYIDPKTAQENIAGVEAKAGIQWSPLSFVSVESNAATQVELGEDNEGEIRTFSGDANVVYTINEFIKMDLGSKAGVDDFIDLDKKDHFVNARLGATYSPLTWLEVSGFYQLDLQEPMSSTERLYENEVALTLKAGL
jgi:hypothetical protein